MFVIDLHLFKFLIVGFAPSEKVKVFEGNNLIIIRNT